MKAKHSYAPRPHPPVINDDTEFVCEEHRTIYKAKNGCPDCLTPPKRKDKTMTTYKAFVIIKDQDGEWEEDLEVFDPNNAEQEVKNIVRAFNATRRPLETERSFVKLLRIETYEED